MKILVIEDEKKISDFVCAGLTERGFEVEACDNGQTGFEQARLGQHDTIVLDLMLPGRDGLSVLRGLRAEGITTPVILLTARNELGDRIEGLNLGADDYLAKPFYVEELAARIQALLRRQSGERQNTIQVGPFMLDCMVRQVTVLCQTIELTPREFALIELLMRSPGRVLTRTQMLEHVWGYDFDPATNVVDVCVQRIRRKIESIDAGAGSASPIESVRGVGYRFRVLP